MRLPYSVLPDELFFTLSSGAGSFAAGPLPIGGLG